ncbi:MFS transporter [Hydrogenophaga sp. BPS33]|nr:MFS transporter [Hydrogenophaga sp. BPS33]
MSNRGLPRSLWALMVGNFVIGTGVMVVPGTLNDISQALDVSIPQAGQLITAAAILMGVGAPVLASLVAGWDRRRLLALSLLWYGLLTAACALAPNYAVLLPLRVLAVISPAVFTPQAAASVGLLVGAAQRGRGITFVFLGWSVASVLGMPMSAWISGELGWRWAFALVALMAFASSAWVWRAMPNGIRPAALSRESWGRTLGSAALMTAVSVTLLSSFGQFVLMAYFAPYIAQVFGGGGVLLSLMLLWFGVFALAGNMAATHYIDRIGAARTVLISVGCMALTMLLWPLGRHGAWTQALVFIPWALGCFAANSAQQARLVHMSPELAPATVALNSSAIYGGQAMGAALGGVMIAQGGMLRLHEVGLVVLLAAMATSVWAGWLQKRSLALR